MSKGDFAQHWCPSGQVITRDMIALGQKAKQFKPVVSLFDAWDETSMKHLKLTSVGLAIGHANAVRVVGFDAPLGIWIK